MFSRETSARLQHAILMTSEWHWRESACISIGGQCWRAASLSLRKKNPQQQLYNNRGSNADVFKQIYCSSWQWRRGRLSVPQTPCFGLGCTCNLNGGERAKFKTLTHTYDHAHTARHTHTPPHPQVHTLTVNTAHRCWCVPTNATRLCAYTTAVRFRSFIHPWIDSPPPPHLACS